MNVALQPLVTYGRMIKLSHSIFALPFALAAAVLVAREVPVTWTQLALIVACMVTARSSAMGFNRVVDRDYDAKNPRTATREIPAGQISVAAAWGFTLASAALFVAFAALLGPATLMLSPIALAVLWGYSLAKRFTSLVHLWLGVAQALAPVAVWIALAGHVSPAGVLLGAAVGSWVAGFDLIYACQDAKFDRDVGLFSIPSRFGLGPALGLSALLHVVTVACLAALPFFAALGPIYWVGVVAIGGLLAYEHAIVSPTDLSRLGKAFFDLNGWVSVFFLGFVLVS